MEKQKINDLDKGVNASMLEGNSSDSKKSQKSTDKKPHQWNWFEIVRTIRAVGSIATVLLTLIKILEELGLLP